MSEPTHFRLVEKEYRTDRNYAFIKCPDCGSIGKVDRDQFEGRVSMICPDASCGWHETHDMRNHDAE